MCQVCGGRSRGTVKKTVGTLVQILHKCNEPSCSFKRVWCSQPYLKHMPAGNLITMAAILLSGSLPTQAMKIFKFMKMALFSKSVYHRHQTNHVIPSIIISWQRQQSTHLLTLQDMEGGLELAGDGRSDSPGHSAKYGGYNVIEQRINKVLDIQVVQVLFYLIH